MDNLEEQLHTQVMETLLEYLDNKRTLRSVLVVGMNAYNKLYKTDKETFYEVLSELNAMGNHIGNGEAKQYSREKVKDIFTTMLEKLTKS